MSFEEAFEKTKLSWDKELKPYWKGGLNLEDVSDFMRRMFRIINIGLLRKSLQFTVIIFVFYLLIAWLPLIFFEIITYFILFSSVLVPIIFFIVKYEMFSLAKKYPNYILTIYQGNTVGFVGFIAPIIKFLDRFFYDSEGFQKIMQFQLSPNANFWDLFFILLSFFIIIFGALFTIISQKNYLRQIEKVKPFLQYLH